MINGRLKQRFLSYLLITISLLNFSCENRDPYRYESLLQSYKYVPADVPADFVPYKKPSSRKYLNPYVPAPRNYYPYYDMERYYVPPNYYNGYYNNTEEGIRDPAGSQSYLHP